MITSELKTTSYNLAPTLDQNLNELTFKLNPTHAMVECHPDISQILYRCQSCLSDCHLELQTHWQQLQEKFVCSLFVGVQYCQITKPCLCGKWQIRVTKVKKKITIRKSGWAKAPPPPSPTPCAVPVLRMEDYFMSKTSQLPYYRKLMLHEINANR